jgi:hypothetical protein
MLWKFYDWFDHLVGVSRVLVALSISAVIGGAGYVAQIGLEKHMWWGPCLAVLVVVVFALLASSRIYHVTGRTSYTSDFLAKWMLTILGFIFCGLPTWIMLFAKYFLNPEGFWQKFALYGIGVWLLGTQLFFLILYSIVLFKIWVSKR